MAKILFHKEILSKEGLGLKIDVSHWPAGQYLVNLVLKDYGTETHSVQILR